MAKPRRPDVDELLPTPSPRSRAELVSAMAKDPLCAKRAGSRQEGAPRSVDPGIRREAVSARRDCDRARGAPEARTRHDGTRRRDNVKERRASIKAKYKLSDADVEGVEHSCRDKEVNWTHDAAARVT